MVLESQVPDLTGFGKYGYEKPANRKKGKYGRLEKQPTFFIVMRAHFFTSLIVVILAC